MKKFRLMSRRHRAINLSEVRAQNRISYDTLYHRILHVRETEWLNKPATKEYLATASANSVSAAYDLIHDATLVEVDHIWSLK